VQKPPLKAEAPAPETGTPPQANQTDFNKPATREGYATWYDVPPNSLTKERAGNDELTAAHVYLPFGTLVRVTHLVNGKSVIVRIIDRCVPRHHRMMIDLSREAAEKLEMIREGSARVRLEVLPNDKATADAPESTSSNAHP
jgi:rare lipoprotein A